MNTSALLTFSGRDRPGIVARATQLLFECGCNIADSSMTRLAGEFTVMLILQLPPEMTTTGLAQRFQPLADEMALSIQMRPLTDASLNPAPPLGHTYTINVLGADQPGIVFRVTQRLAEAHCNITDLYTHRTSSAKKPVYSMVIEIESDHEPEKLQQQLSQVENMLDVEITLRPTETFLM